MPDNPDYCPAEFTKAGEPNTDHQHCDCWYDCEPCCRCGDDTPDPNCDCQRCTIARAKRNGETILNDQYFLCHDPECEARMMHPWSKSNEHYHWIGMDQ